MTPENIAALQSLIQADPALAEQMQSATTTDSAVQLLAQAASQKGIAVDAHAIAEHLESARTVQISDNELEAVAGGLLRASGYDVLSVLTFAIACEMYSQKNPGRAGNTDPCKFK